MLIQISVLAILILFSGVAIATEERPNIILLVTDDQRWDALGAAGNEIIHTPNLDALARDGVMFSNCFCTTSICCTSRASILSGQYARRHEIWGFRTPFSDDAFAKTFPVLLREAGYRTGFVGKWGVGGKTPSDQYDYWAGYEGQGRYYEKDDTAKERHLTRRLTEQALEFLEGCSQDQPFCLQVSYKSPHCQDGHEPQFPFDVALGELYTDVEIQPALTATDRHFRSQPPFLQSSEARQRWGLRFDGDAMFQESVKSYYRLISGVDVSIGKIVQSLQEKGVADNTVILFISDNGYYLGEYGLAGKWFMHDPSIRLPMFVYDPRLPASAHGQVSEEMVLNIDIAPTILEAAGLDRPQAMQGESVMPLVRGQDVDDWRRDFLYEHLFEHTRIPQTEGVRNGRWKYVRYSSVEPLYEELFDLASDPWEEDNLAQSESHEDTLEEMRSRWEELVNEAK